MTITSLGHSAFHVNLKNMDILIDPMINGNPLASNISIADLKADYILVSHGHSDHTGDTQVIAKRTGATIISNFEIVTWFAQSGCKGHGMNHGGKYTFPFGTVKYVNAVHSSTLPDGSSGGDAGGFVIYNEETCFYFAGDTALTMDMKLIPMTCPPLSFAILPVGDNFTMGFEDALLAASFIECDTIIGCHYNTFDAISIDTEEATEAFRKAGKQLILPEPGQIINL
jgi:L-ascorbate metabolism protein UlaG (beta-lactamase superfamily)